MRTKGAKGRGDSSKVETRLGFVIDPYLGRLPILQVGDAGEGELCYRVFRKVDIVSDWRDHSEVVSVQLTNSGKKEAEHIRELMR